MKKAPVPDGEQGLSHSISDPRWKSDYLESSAMKDRPRRAKDDA